MATKKTTKSGSKGAASKTAASKGTKAKTGSKPAAAKANTAVAKPAANAGVPAAPKREPRTSPAEFVRQVRREAKKVTWPTRKETMVSTLMVLILSFVAGIFFLLVDNAAAWGIQTILGLGR